MLRCCQDSTFGSLHAVILFSGDRLGSMFYPTCEITLTTLKIAIWLPEVDGIAVHISATLFFRETLHAPGFVNMVLHRRIRPTR